MAQIFGQIYIIKTFVVELKSISLKSFVNHNLQAIRLERYIYLLHLMLKITPLTKCYLTATATINFVEPLIKWCPFVESSWCFCAGLAISPCLWLFFFYILKDVACQSILFTLQRLYDQWPSQFHIICQPLISVGSFLPGDAFNLWFIILYLHFLWFWVMLSTCDL